MLAGSVPQPTGRRRPRGGGCGATRRIHPYSACATALRPAPLSRTLALARDHWVYGEPAAQCPLGKGRPADSARPQALAELPSVRVHHVSTTGGKVARDRGPFWPFSGVVIKYDHC